MPSIRRFLLLAAVCPVLNGCAGVNQSVVPAPTPKYFSTSRLQLSGYLGTEAAPYTIPLTLYDAQGQAFTVNLTFTHDETLPTGAPATAVSAWEYTARASGVHVVSDSGVVYFDDRGWAINFTVQVTEKNSDGTSVPVLIDFQLLAQSGAKSSMTAVAFLTTATTTVVYSGNLSTLTPGWTTTDTYSRSVKIYDTMSNRVVVELDFTKDATPSATAPSNCRTSWAYNAITSGDGQVVGTGHVYYDANGIYIPAVNAVTVINTDGAESPQAITLDFSKTTSTTADSTLAPSSVDGGPYSMLPQ